MDVSPMRSGAALMMIAVAILIAACGGTDASGSAADTSSTMRLHAHRTKFQPIYQSKQGSRPGVRDARKVRRSFERS